MLLIGAGIPRTGTMSLKLALEQLTGSRCYHMLEVVDDHPTRWARALEGDLGELETVLDGYACTLDWPAAAFWQVLADRHPETPVLLSRRADAEAWWRSADATVWEAMRRFFADPPPGRPELVTMSDRLMTGFDPEWRDPTAAKVAYDRHLRAVRAGVAADRLFEYQPGDGWTPLCAALGLPEPDVPFPNVNSTAQFRKHQKWD